MQTNNQSQPPGKMQHRRCCVSPLPTYCKDRLKILLHFALLHFALLSGITFCVKSYYILRYYYILRQKVLHFALLLHFVSVITFCGVTYGLLESVFKECVERISIPQINQLVVPFFQRSYARVTLKPARAAKMDCFKPSVRD